MKCLLVLFLVLVPVVGAEGPPLPDPKAAEAKPATQNPTEWTLRMFPLKYADAEQLRRLLSAFSYPISTNSDFNVLSLRAPNDFLSQVDGIVKRFDVAPQPPKNVELTVYLLNGADAPGPTPLPKDLLELEKQLVAASSFKAFKLSDSQVIRIRPGMPGEASGGQALSRIRFRAGWINSDDKGRILSFDGLRVELKNTAVSTEIDLRENQWAVIGRVNPDGVLAAMARVSE